MRPRRTTGKRRADWTTPRVVSAAVLLALAPVSLLFARPAVPLQAPQKTKLPRPRRLDEDVTWKRDPVTGELTAIPAGSAAKGSGDASISADTHAISVVTQIVPVTCSVIGADGVAVRVFEDTPAVQHVVLTALTWIMHRNNIARLLDGSESKIGKSAVA